MVTYYYDGMAHETLDGVMNAVRNDVDFCLGDADLDAVFRENGGVYLDGDEYDSCISLKRHDYKVYKEKRDEVVDWIVSEVRDGAEMGIFPIQVPFTYNVLECSE